MSSISPYCFMPIQIQMWYLFFHPNKKPSLNPYFNLYYYAIAFYYNKLLRKDSCINFPQFSSPTLSYTTLIRSLPLPIQQN